MGPQPSGRIANNADDARARGLSQEAAECVAVPVIRAPDALQPVTQRVFCTPERRRERGLNDRYRSLR